MSHTWAASPPAFDVGDEGGGGILGGVIEVTIAVVALVFGCGGAGVGIAWLNDRRRAAAARRIPKEDARAMLERRLAKGEIDEAEYARKMHLLMFGPPLELDRPEH